MFAASMQAVNENMCGRGLKGEDEREQAIPHRNGAAGETHFSPHHFQRASTCKQIQNPVLQLHPKGNTVSLHVKYKFNAR